MNTRRTLQKGSGNKRNQIITSLMAVYGMPYNKAVTAYNKMNPQQKSNFIAAIKTTLPSETIMNARARTAGENQLFHITPAGHTDIDPNDLSRVIIVRHEPKVRNYIQTVTRQRWPNIDDDIRSAGTTKPGKYLNMYREKQKNGAKPWSQMTPKEQQAFLNATKTRTRQAGTTPTRSYRTEQLPVLADSKSYITEQLPVVPDSPVKQVRRRINNKQTGRSTPFGSSYVIPTRRVAPQRSIRNMITNAFQSGQKRVKSAIQNLDANAGRFVVDTLRSKGILKRGMNQNRRTKYFV